MLDEDRLEAMLLKFTGAECSGKEAARIPRRIRLYKPYPGRCCLNKSHRTSLIAVTLTDLPKPHLRCQSGLLAERCRSCIRAAQASYSVGNDTAHSAERIVPAKQGEDWR
jgi:hypothetical protein